MKEIGKLAVDTNAIIAFRAGVPDVCMLIKSADSILLPAMVMGELLFGALNSQRIRENYEAAQKFLSLTTFIPVNEQITERYAAVRKKLKEIGRPMPENDIWIAASCIELDVPLLTMDAHFNNVEKRKTVRWVA